MNGDLAAFCMRLLMFRQQLIPRIVRCFVEDRTFVDNVSGLADSGARIRKRQVVIMWGIIIMAAVNPVTTSKRNLIWRCKALILRYYINKSQ